jgi:YggT family protein
MYVMGYFLLAVATICDYVLLIYMWVVIASAVLSWVSPDPYNPIVRFIRNVTEPVLYRIRQYVPVNFGGIDFSPMLVILVIYFLRIFAVNTIMRTGMSMIR